MPTFHGSAEGLLVSIFFFVISGFLITKIIINERLAGTFTIASFYERRIRRIFPALFALMVCTTIVGWFVLPGPDLNLYSQSLVSTTAFASNWLLWLQGGYFDTAAVLKPLHHTWSLAVEEQFYAIYPFLLIGITPRLNRKYRLIIFGIVIVLSMGASLILLRTDPSAGFYLLPSRLWELAIGGALADTDLDSFREKMSYAMGEVGTLLGCLLIAVAVHRFNSDTPHPSLLTAVPVIGAACIIIFAHPRSIFSRIFTNSWAIGLGLVSYSFYLWHYPVFTFARYMALRDLRSIDYVLLTIVSLALAYLSFKFVESPFRKRQVVPSPILVRFFAVGSLSLVAFGVVGFVTKGFPSRFGGGIRGIVQLTVRRVARSGEVSHKTP